MNNRYPVHQWLMLSGLLIAGMIAPVSANSAEMSFSGILISAPKCTMTEEPMAVRFGLIDVGKVEFGLYEQPLEYTPKCNGYEHAGDYHVSLMLKGAAADFNDSYLATDNINLAIKFSTGTGILEVNQSMLIADIKKWPVLKAILAKRQDVKLSAGKFSATATLMIDVM